MWTHSVVAFYVTKRDGYLRVMTTPSPRCRTLQHRTRRSIIAATDTKRSAGARGARRAGVQTCRFRPSRYPASTSNRVGSLHRLGTRPATLRTTVALVVDGEAR